MNVMEMGIGEKTKEIYKQVKLNKDKNACNLDIHTAKLQIPIYIISEEY